jgi:3-methyladenine DNA glycosylase AlkC
MAEPLKNRFGAEVARRIARLITRTGHPFDEEAFLAEVLHGFEPLTLMERGWHIARVLGRHLPADYPAALDILLRSLDRDGDEPVDDHPMSAFRFLPHTLFVAEHGLDDFEPSMRAQHRLTQIFTAEFSIRPFLRHRREATLARLREWTLDPSPHVRRLVSEGTRPRLPWAPRLREFETDPRPVIELLERLKDDPEPFVRRSVANNLNDIGKDHPQLLLEIARAWLEGAGEGRRWIVRHALRSSVKRVEPGALELLGFGDRADVEVGRSSIEPASPVPGGSVVLSAELTNRSARPLRVLVDCRVHFVKANGRTSPKVFKVRSLELGAGASERVRKTISLAELTTRKHYPGEHRVELLLNGRTVPIGAFLLRAGVPAG